MEVEVARLMDLDELRVSDEVAIKLKRMSSATIDRKLKHQGGVLRLLRSKGDPKPGSHSSARHLYGLPSGIPQRLAMWRWTWTFIVVLLLLGSISVP